jgi:hypothetical protein
MYALAAILCSVGLLMAYAMKSRSFRKRGQGAQSTANEELSKTGAANANEVAVESVTETEANTNLMMMDMDDQSDSGKMPLPL